MQAAGSVCYNTYTNTYNTNTSNRSKIAIISYELGLLSKHGILFYMHCTALNIPRICVGRCGRRVDLSSQHFAGINFSP